ncbi:MAG: hypothetical protein ACRD04_02645 [Terriglobales bacterium]
MRRAWILTAAFAAGAVIASAQAPLTPLQVLQRAIQRDHADSIAQQQYAWHERDIVTEIGRKDRPGKVESDETDDVSEVDGIEYDRIIARDGKPLSPKQAAKEARKAAAFIRKHNNPKVEAKDLAEQAKERRESRKLIDTFAEAFHLAFTPPSVPAPCNCWGITLAPRKRFHTRDHNLDLLHHVRGTLWISRQNFGMEQANFLVLQTLSLGWVLARIEKGSTFEFKNNLVDGHWFGQSLTGTVNARVLLVKPYHLLLDDTYTDYRRFGVSSRVIAQAPVSHPR